MTSLVETPAPPFHRSHSSPASNPPHGLSLDKLPSSPPSFEIPSFDSDFDLGSSPFTVTKDDFSPSTTSASTAPDTPQEQSRPPLPRSKTAFLKERPRSWFPGSKSSRDEPAEPKRQSTPPVEENGPKRGGRPGPSGLSDLRPMERSLSVSDSFANFAKRSWISSSRSPSPKRRPSSAEVSVADEDTGVRVPNKLTRTRRVSERNIDKVEQIIRSQSPAESPSRTLRKASNYFVKMKSKQAGALTKLNNGTDSDNSCASSAVSLVPPASNSYDARTSHSASCDSSSSVDDLSKDMPPQLRDGLWSSFKTLEVEFKSFVAKQTSPRICQIQTIVLPFLRGTTNHPSTKKLRPEDVDRRATILSKWWAAILEMLDGQGVKGLQPVPGVDRPILLEAATVIMMRPEWRRVTSSFQPLAERRPESLGRPRSWSNTSESTISSNQGEFLTQSAEHNVRTMFVSNLTKQVALVVDKMSLRHAPLSLVNFAGKTCAFAFFFAPAVAEILVRLWGLSPDLIRRASTDLGMTALSKADAEEIAARFPSPLRGLSWISSRAMWNGLKQIPQLPMVVTQIPWTGPWISRWKGRDTDLFFIFCKYYHVLADQFIPAGLSLPQKAASPAFVLVQAQLLSTLDATIHRQAAMDYALNFQSPFDSDGGADAMALAMPLPTTNMMKGMADNRLIVLLKHFVGDETADIAGARHTFAQAFAALMKTVTSKTSQYDHPACYTLCDLLEQSFSIYHAFEMSGNSASYLDWPYWFDVLGRILGSLNTMSEIRILCFVYTAWDILAKDPRRKEMLCLDWLLKEDVFEALFNHWCPMVRAYYHRLLCWRICREDGGTSEVDRTIFNVAAARLKTVWAHYLYLKQKAEESGRLPPSTAAMFPLPGRKFIIIRQEIDSPQPGLFMGFDAFTKPPSAEESIDLGVSDDLELTPKSEVKKRWSLLGKVLSLTAGTKADQVMSGKQHSRSASWDEALQEMDRDLADIRPRAVCRVPSSKALSEPSVDADTESVSSTPVIEEQRYIFKFFLGWQQPVVAPRERLLTRPRLPEAAHEQICVRSRANTISPPPDAGLVMATRAVSGDSRRGLIDEAKNAQPFETSTAEMLRTTSAETEAGSSSTYNEIPAEESEKVSRESERVLEPVTKPVKPVGIYARNGVYAGRALAEWAQVVFECNSFIDRRRDEGVEDIGAVEVPMLGVEGFRRLSG